MPRGLRDLGSLTRDWTWVLSTESTESYLLDEQGSPKDFNFFIDEN